MVFEQPCKFGFPTPQDQKASNLIYRGMTIVSGKLVRSSLGSWSAQRLIEGWIDVFVGTNCNGKSQSGQRSELEKLRCARSRGLDEAFHAWQLSHAGGCITSVGSLGQ
jgi:hypothetical protein